MLLQRLDADYIAVAIGGTLGEAAGYSEMDRHTINELAIALQ